MCGSSVKPGGEEGLLDDARKAFKGKTWRGGASEDTGVTQATRAERAGRQPKCSAKRRSHQREGALEVSVFLIVSGAC